MTWIDSWSLLTIKVTLLIDARLYKKDNDQFEAFMGATLLSMKLVEDEGMIAFVVAIFCGVHHDHQTDIPTSEESGLLLPGRSALNQYFEGNTQCHSKSFYHSFYMSN